MPSPFDTPPWPRLSTWLLDQVFPPRCLGCDRHGAYLCPSCLDAVTRLAPGWQPPETIGALDGWAAPFAFDGIVRQAIHSLKYQGLKAVAAPLSEEITRHLEALPQEAVGVAPVPLHPQRLRERGFNQAALLARPLAEAVGLPLLDGLARLRPTTPQIDMASAAARRDNVRGAFGWKGPHLQGRSILLLDDVSTTGATLNAAAEALKAGGAGAVWGLVLAKELS